jgi:hypothetical protein
VALGEVAGGKGSLYLPGAVSLSRQAWRGLDAAGGPTRAPPRLPRPPCDRSRTAVAPLERLKILMQVQGNDKIYKGVAQVRHAAARHGGRTAGRPRGRAAARQGFATTDGCQAGGARNSGAWQLRLAGRAWRRRGVRALPRPEQRLRPRAAAPAYAPAGPLPHSTPPAPSPLLQGLMHMAKAEGVRGMMKGNWTNCVRIIPNSAMKFFTFEQLCRCGAARRQQPGTRGSRRGGRRALPCLRAERAAGGGCDPSSPERAHPPPPSLARPHASASAPARPPPPPTGEPPKTGSYPTTSGSTPAAASSRRGCG